MKHYVMLAAAATTLLYASEAGAWKVTPQPHNPAVPPAQQTQFYMNYGNQFRFYGGPWPPGTVFGIPQRTTVLPPAIPTGYRETLVNSTTYNSLMSIINAIRSGVIRTSPGERSRTSVNPANHDGWCGGCGYKQDGQAIGTGQQYSPF